MGIVKMADLHYLLDLVDKACGNPRYFCKLEYCVLGERAFGMNVDFSVSDIQDNYKTIFRREFFVNSSFRNDRESAKAYSETRKFLLELISENTKVEENTTGKARFVGIGVNAGKVVEMEDAFRYAKMEIDGFKDDEVEELVDWFYSGEWIKEEGDEYEA